jgi:hypothetical protein
VATTYTNWLKEGARYICNHSNNFDLLSQALEFSDWAAITDNEPFSSYAQYISACILYKLNKKEEAISKMKKAISLLGRKPQQSISFNRYQGVLNKMLNNEPHVVCL